MSDLDTMKEMLNRAGVVFHEAPASETLNDPPKDAKTELRMEAHEGPNNHGYSCFIACLFFTGEGRLCAVGAWE